MIGDKKRWREFKARTRALPESYRTAVEGFTRYLMYFGAVDGDKPVIAEKQDLGVHAALGVFGTGSAWPDLAVASLMAALALHGGWTVLQLARGEQGEDSAK